MTKLLGRASQRRLARVVLPEHEAPLSIETMKEPNIRSNTSDKSLEHNAKEKAPIWRMISTSHSVT